MRRLFIAAVALAAGCSDALEQDTTAGQAVAVVNSGSATLSLVSATNFAATTYDLLSPSGGPTSIAGRSSLVTVPLAAVDSVVFTDFGSTGATRRIPLASGAGAAGVAIGDDSTAWVANPTVDRVTWINYRTGATGTLAVGHSPQAVEVTRRTLYVVNANLSGSVPAGPSSISWMWLPGPAPTTLPTIPLTGTNAQFAVVGGDSLLYVIARGSPGAGDGKLSIVDPATHSEVAVLNGLGELPGPAAFHPSGRLLIASEREGVLEVNTLTRTLVRGPGAGIKPASNGVAALAVDQRGRVYALDRGDCTQPGVVHVLAAPPSYAELKAVAVGVCPSAAALVLLQHVP